MSMMSCRACGGLYDTDEGEGFYIQDENCAEYELPYVLCDSCRDEIQGESEGVNLQWMLEKKYGQPVKLVRQAC